MKDELINMTRASPTEIEPMTSETLGGRKVLQWIEHPPGVGEFMDSIPVGDSHFFFVPQTCHVDQFTQHEIRRFYSLINSSLVEKMNLSHRELF